MAQRKKESFSNLKDWTQRNRGWILYGSGLLALLGLLACWALLPEQVALQVVPEGQTAVMVEKYSAMGATAAVVAIFAAFFAWKPRELPYFVALCLGEFLLYSLLIINVVL